MTGSMPTERRASISRTAREPAPGASVTMKTIFFASSRAMRPSPAQKSAFFKGVGPEPGIGPTTRASAWAGVDQSVTGAAPR